MNNMMDHLLADENMLFAMVAQLDSATEQSPETVPIILTHIIDLCYRCNAQIIQIALKFGTNLGLQDLHITMTPDVTIQVTLNNIHIIKYAYGYLVSSCSG